MAILNKEATFENPEFRIFPNDLNVTDNQIQRGYMRLLSENLMIGDSDFKTAEEQIGTVKAALQHEKLGTKLNFQFNPNQLTRSVTARTDTQLWINQSPSQLLQPGIGDMNFGWSMLFNREAEVSANKVATERRTASGMEVDRPTLDQYMSMGDVRPTSPSGRQGISGWESIFHGGTEEAAKVLGVLADISILDRITGQSITRESYDYAKKRFETLKAQGLAYDTAEGVGSELKESEAMSMEEAADAAFGEGKGATALLEANVYNSAFLVPNPVRVVFSEHFMVDGYVNQVTVTFQKFSPEMIPTVATVDISMHAIYQGFTRQKSAFTTFIKLQHELDKDDDTSDGSKETYTGDDVYVRGLAAQGGVEYGGAPLFTGFDHRGDGLKVSTFNTPLKTTDPGCRQRQQIVLDEGLSFAPFCYLHDTQLGKVISEQISRVDQSSGVFEGESTGHWVSNNIDAHVWTGLQVRARLKALGDETGQSDPKAKLAMAVLLDGETGMSGWGEDGEVFFTEWSKGMRSDLLAVGYDNMAKTEFRKSKIKERFGDPTRGDGQFADVGPYYTRSFPILANGMQGEPEYGDQLYMQKFHAQGGIHIDWLAPTIGSGDDRTLSGTPFACIHGGPDGALKWGQDEEGTDPVTFYIAKGFWSSGNYPWDSSSSGKHNAEPFIDKLRIYRNGYGINDPNPEYKEFDIEYQINMLYRVKVTQTVEDAPISDTDWLVVHPRRKPLNYVDEGSKGIDLEALESTHPLNWGGTNNVRLNSDDHQSDVWIYADNRGGHQFKDLYFHFDGYSYDEGGGGVHMWPRTLFQSHEGNHRGAFFQEGHAGGGLFKKLRTEE
jgi:hypothetical protein